MKNSNSYFLSLSRSVSFLQHCFLSFFPPLMSTSVLSGCHVFLFFSLSSERQMRNKRETKPRGSCPHIITTPFISPSPHPLVHYPPSFCLPEWQLAASRVQWACQPKCRNLPTDLRKYTFDCDCTCVHAVALRLLLQVGLMQHTFHCLLAAELCGH